MSSPGSVLKYSPSAMFCAGILLHFALNTDYSKLLDKITRSVHQTLSVKFQRYLRDTGIVRCIADNASLAIALMMGISRPRLVLDFLKLGMNIRKLPYKTSSLHFLEIIPSLQCKNIDGYSPSGQCLVFVHGGAWGSGQVWHYRLIAEGLGRLLGTSAIILVGYPVYPLSNIQEQSQCVTDALQFINTKDGPVLNVLNECGATDSLILAGHSSGANICALALLEALREEQRCQSSDLLPQPAGAFSRVQTFIGLAGVYDVEKHFLFEAVRGVHEVSPMAGAAGGPAGFAACSPTLVSKQIISVNKDSASGVFRQGVVSAVDCVLIHGTEDTTVPHTSSEEFAQELRTLGFNTFVNFVACDHGAPVLDLMSVDTLTTEVTDAILQGWNASKKQK